MACLKLLLTITLIVLTATGTAFAQTGPLLLQKRGRTVKTFFEGSHIEFLTRYKTPMQGIISRFKNDTLYIRDFSIQKSMSSLGGVYFDTLYFPELGVHYRDIGYFRPEKNKATARRLGGFMQKAGVAWLLMNVINGALKQEPRREWLDTPNAILTGTLLAGGTALKIKAGKDWKIGRKYQLSMLDLGRKQRKSF